MGSLGENMGYARDFFLTDMGLVPWNAGGVFFRSQMGRGLLSGFEEYSAYSHSV